MLHIWTLTISPTVVRDEIFRRMLTSALHETTGDRVRVMLHLAIETAADLLRTL